MATPIDLTAVRLEAARNTGITVEFQRDMHRAFTGSIADYQDLTQDQQLRLAAEMQKILKAAPPAVAAADNATVQGAIARLGSPPPPPPPSTAVLLAEGAIEGLTSIPANIAKGVTATVKYTNTLAGDAFTAATGSTLGSLLTKLGIAAIVVGGVYLFVVSGGAEKTALRIGRRIATRKRSRK